MKIKFKPVTVIYNNRSSAPGDNHFLNKLSIAIDNDILLIGDSS